MSQILITKIWQQPENSSCETVKEILITTLGPAKIIASNSEPTTIFFKQVNS